MKKIFKLALKCILLIILTTIILFLLNKEYAKTITNKYADTFKFQYIPDNVMLSNIGSSHAEYGFQYESAPELENLNCFNFALASQSYDYDLGLLEMYKDHMGKSGVLFIPVSYFSFNDEVTNEAEKDSMQVRYYSFMKPKYIPNYSLYQDIITHRMPILSADENLLTWIAESLFPTLEVQAEGSILTPEEAIEKAQVRYERHFVNKDNYFYPKRIKELKSIIQFCKENNIQPILISTPVTRYYHDLIADDFFTDFYHTIDDICSETDVSYYDYSYDDRFRGNLAYFSDADHLNTEGSIYFFSIIEQEIPEVKKLLTEHQE